MVDRIAETVGEYVQAQCEVPQAAREPAIGSSPAPRSDDDHRCYGSSDNDDEKDGDDHRPWD